MLAELARFNHKNCGGIAAALDSGGIIPSIDKILLSKYLAFSNKGKSDRLHRM